MKNKKEEAAALKYDSNKDRAPVVLAQGTGKTAELILKRAEEERIPLVKDPVLLSCLMQVEPFMGIPEELYEVVAAVYRTLIKLETENKML